MPKKAAKNLVAENQELRVRLAELQETLDAIKRGEIDGLVISTPKGEQVYSITGAETPYRLLIEEMKEGALMLSDDNTILYANKGFAKIVKQPLVEIVGKNIEGIIDPVHLKTFKEILYLSRSRKDVVENQIALKAKDNSLVPVHISVALLTKNDPKTTLLIATDLTQHMEEQLKNYTLNLEKEITERKKAEETLLSKERELTSIYLSVPEVLFFLSVTPQNSFRFISVSQSFLNATGLLENQVVGKSIQEVIPEPSLSLVLEKYAQAIRERKTVRWEEVTDYPAGRKYGEVAATPFFDSSGRCTNLIGSVYDVTELKKAEESLKASEKKANDLIKYAPSGIYELDYRIPPKFRSVNDAMCQILGYTREELLATSPFALLDDESKTRFQERIVKMLAGEKVDETVEFKVIAKDGREIYATLNTTFTYKDGKPDGALVIAHDVTERRKAELELEKRAKNLESLVEERTNALRDSERLAAIGATAGMVGHDIRNPLQAITSDIYLTKTDLASLPESEEKKNIQESITEIEKNIYYINKIVADLQDFARPLTPKLEETNVEQIIISSVANLGIPENVTIEQFVSKDFPKLKTDPAYVQRIVTNLANNAIQAMPNGGKLTIVVDQKGSKVVISVEDTGMGIPESVRRRIFTPLVTTKSKGQGFGLSVVKRFTEALGGTVSFESEAGKGTKFIIELPL
jgi:PAS domain S-box-containing protein